MCCPAHEARAHYVKRAQKALATWRQDQHRLQLMHGEAASEVEVRPKQLQKVQNGSHLPRLL